MVEFTSKFIWVFLSFLCEKIIIDSIYLIEAYFRLSVSSWESFVRLYLSKNWSISSRSSKLWTFITHLYYSFSGHGICSDVPSFISYVNNLCPLFFSLLTWLRGLLILLVFFKETVLFSLIFFIDFCFQFHWFLLLFLLFLFFINFGFNFLFFF